MSRLATHPRRPAAAGRATDAGAAVRLSYAALAVLLVAYIAVKVAGADHNQTLIDGWMVDAFELAAGGLCVARGLRARSGGAVAIVLGLALVSWSLGDLALTIESLGGATPPTPSVADAFYLGFFPLAYVAIVLLMHGQAGRLPVTSWLDAGVAGLGAAAVCSAFAFHSLLKLAGGSPLEVATNLAYPIGDLLLLFLVAGASVMLAGRSRAPWLLLATGIAINVAGDTFNLFGSSVGSSRVGSLVNAAAWPTSILLMSIAVWLRPGRQSPLATERPPGFLLPGAGAAAGLVILVFASVHATPVVAVGLATATMLVVGVRLALSARSLRGLTQKRYEQSVTDELTGLGNRRFLFAILDRYFAEGFGEPAPATSMAFLFVDLNRFKELNDSFGHPAGDAILRQLGERLRNSLRETDVLVRLGGDEFAVIAMGADTEYAVGIAERLTSSLEEPFILDAVSPRISASIGIALAPADATDSAALLWCADVAMYRAKSSGAHYALYDQQEDLEGAGNGLRLAEELRAAIEQDELVLHYQPQLGLGRREITTVEALVRWRHPRLGLVPPLRFLPVAEEAGLMPRLTGWVLERALEQCRAWRAAGRRVSVSVNVSATNLLDIGFTDVVGELLARLGLPPEALVLELTETSIIKDFERSREVIDRLRQMGIVVSIDDFGAGFTSLAYLSSLAVGEVKLDRTFVTRLAGAEPERPAQLVRATIELIHALGLRVVAEGVEDDATLSLLSDFGCDLAQGYFIEIPRPAAELECLQPAGADAGSDPARLRPAARVFPRALRGAPSTGA